MTTESVRIVIDSNVIVSALLIKQSIARQAFDLALQKGELLQSTYTLAELHETLGRRKFDKYISVDDRQRFLMVLAQTTTLVEIISNITECRDPKDNKFLELAIDGAASLIVSGDADLLILHPFRNIPIRTPRQFVDENL